MKKEIEKREFDRWLAEWLAQIKRTGGVLLSLHDEWASGADAINDNEAGEARDEKRVKQSR